MRDILLAGIVHGQEEFDAVNRVLHTTWHCSGPECTALQHELAELIGVKYCVALNSGSSANLLALSTLDLPPNSKVLTSACGFPATLNPIIHLGHVPVLVDYDLKTLQVDLDQVEETLAKHPDTKAMLIAHTLGSMADIDRLLAIADKHGVTLIEDCCEAIGSKYDGKSVGCFGKNGTVSFYSSHQVNGLGGGGALLTNSPEVYNQAKSMRDWGKRNVREGNIYTKMDTQVAGIMYDQQYTYQTIGYNMRFPDANCAYTREQLKRLAGFAKTRQRNYLYLNDKVKDLPLHLMQWPAKAEPAFFGFPIVPQKESCRDMLVEHLERAGVHVRLFFAGNILKHDAYQSLYYESLYQDFPVANYLMRNAFFCGCWPGLSVDDMQYISDTLHTFAW